MKKTAVFLCIAAAVFFAGGCVPKTEQPEKILFSWKAAAVSEERDVLFELAVQQEIKTLFQAFNRVDDEEAVRSFLIEAAGQNIDVYYLTGTPEWALQEDGRSMCEEVEKAALLNYTQEEGQGYKGIVFDVEPYLLDEWDDDREQIMEAFISGAKEAYKLAGEKGLEVVLCIPYFYDTQGMEQQLERLIASCCDTVAVMNYYRGAEKEHLETEAAIAFEHGRRLVNIYEFQPPGKHGLTAENTYYEEGVRAAEENFAAILKAYPDMELFMGIHEFNSFKEAVENE